MKTLKIFSIYLFLMWSSASLCWAHTVVALKPDKDPDRMQKERARLSEFLTRQLEQKTEVVIPMSSAVILEGFKSGTIDLAYLSSMDMIKAQHSRSAELLLGAEVEGELFYQSLWLTLKEKPYESIKDLKGKPVAFASRTSTSGYLIPFADLIKKGLVLGEKKQPEDFFGPKNVWFGTGYVSAVERVLVGDAEAAAVSDYVFLKDKHLTKNQKSKLRVLQSQGPVPTHVLAVRSALDPQQKKLLKKALLQLNQKEHKDLRDGLFNSALREVDANQHLQGSMEALELTGLKASFIR